VPRCQYDTIPTYFVYGGLVLQSLTRDFLTTWDKWWNKAPKELLNYYYAGVRSQERQEIVVLSQILADEINVGYEHLYNEAIATVNGRIPRDMLDLVSTIENSPGVIELKTSSAGTIMLDSAEVARANPRILTRYHISTDRSPDLDGCRRD
jgi:hypothetical protein